MSSWRDDASPRAQGDLDALLDLVLPFAQQQVADRGGFFPYGAYIGLGGVAEFVAIYSDSENPDPSEMYEGCFSALAARRNVIRAAAVAVDVHIDGGAGDAISVDLEHAEGHAITVVLPYWKARFGKRLKYGSMSAQAGEHRIWASSA
jgi:hypothetical protein